METKRFDIITEADARVLEPGSTVRLAARGHITPLAADTLRERRITVIGEDMRATPPGMSLVPVADVRRIAIGSDHAGFDLKAHLIGVLRSRGLQVQDAGTLEKTPVDYPDIAAAVSKIVARQEADAGIVIDGAGLGLGHRRQQGARHPRGHVRERDAGALQPRAQRRQRPRRSARRCSVPTRPSPSSCASSRRR